MKNRAVIWANVLSAVSLAGMLTIVLVCAASALRRQETDGSAYKKYHDFFEFFHGADALAKGGGAHEVFAAGEFGYVYPPMLATGLMWGVPLGMAGAARIWTILNGVELFLSGAVAGLVAARLFTGRAVGWVVVGWRAWMWPLGAGGCLLMMDKLHLDMKAQQSNQIMSLCWCVAGACVLLGRPGEGKSGYWRPVLAGLAIGVGFNIKYVTALALPYLLVRGAWRTMLWGVVWCLALAAAPALVIGWERTVDVWGGALDGLYSAGGATKLNTPGIARLMPMQGFGLSITSTMLELGQRSGLKLLGLLLSGLTAGGLVGIVWLLYRRAGISLLQWRGLWEGADRDERARRLLAVEWAGLIVGMLVFSPQTITLHLVQALCAFTIMLGAATMLGAGVLKGRGRSGLAAVAYGGILLAWLGMVMPVMAWRMPMSAMWWHHVGGPSWCLIAGWLMVLWAVLEAEWVTAGHSDMLASK